ncbi:MAG TPA: hypothetical protein VNO52_13665, partial [Methylomirabilota bacterium]|nr:hypothetical protein [Methylomirabilota bacterium]
MKAETVVAVTALLLAGWCRADIIAQWNFNDTSRTNDIPASAGSGVAALVGGIRATFANGVPSDTPDPGATNFGWNTTAYPAQGTGNKAAGVQFTIDTTGYEDISLRWFLRGSSTASKYVRVQYSLNGVDFIDSSVAALPDANNFHAQLNSFVGIGAVENTVGVVFRIVTEWERSATGGGTDGFVTTSANAYNPNGTLRFDLVTIEGTPATGNQPPTISALSNQTIRVDTPTDELPFTIGDAETPPDQLAVAATSSDERVVRNDAILLGGTGAHRTVQVTPDFGQTGAALITLTVTDSGGRTASTSFLVTVLPANTPPRVSSIAPVYARAGEGTSPVGFTIADAESAPEDLELAVGSSNPTLLPEENIFLGGSGSNRTISLQPVAGQCGVAVVNITVSDPLGESTNTSFAVMTVNSPGLIFCDDFSYADGVVIRVSGGLWRNHSGTIGQMLAGSGRLHVSSAQSEDVNARLAGGPYVFGSGARLYAKFVLNVSTLPVTEYGNYFAHFKDDTAAGFTARVFIQTRGAEPGRYRLAIA